MTTHMSPRVYTGMRLCPLARMALMVAWLRRASAGSMNTLLSGVMDLGVCVCEGGGRGT